MPVLVRRFTILALGSALFALGLLSAVENNRQTVNRYVPLALCSPVSGFKCIAAL